MFIYDWGLTAAGIAEWFLVIGLENIAWQNFIYDWGLTATANAEAFLGGGELLSTFGISG